MITGRSHPKRYDGSVAVVSGASSGIGRQLSLELATRGATVVGVARRATLLESLGSELRAFAPASATVVCDVGDADRWTTVLHGIERDHGRIDVLVNNAGVEQISPIDEGDTDLYRRFMDVNYFGVVAGTFAVLPGMLARRAGIIVNVASDAARAPEPAHGAYSASKAATAAFTESVAHEAAPRGVHVHVLYPAWVPTAMGLSGQLDGGKLPPKAVRRTEEQVARLVCERMGGRRMEINAAMLPLLAPISRTLAPLAYQRAIRRRR